jgi:integrase
VTVLREHRKALIASGLYQSGGFVFPTKRGGPIPHDLRHAFASRAAHRGVPVNVLSEIMGHSHVGVTQKIYATCSRGRDAAEAAFRAVMDG